MFHLISNLISLAYISDPGPRERSLLSSVHAPGRPLSFPTTTCLLKLLEALKGAGLPLALGAWQRSSFYVDGSPLLPVSYSYLWARFPKSSIFLTL